MREAEVLNAEIERNFKAPRRRSERIILWRDESDPGRNLIRGSGSGSGRNRNSSNGSEDGTNSIRSEDYGSDSDAYASDAEDPGGAVDGAAGTKKGPLVDRKFFCKSDSTNDLLKQGCESFIEPPTAHLNWKKLALEQLPLGTAYAAEAMILQTRRMVSDYTHSDLSVRCRWPSLTLLCAVLLLILLSTVVVQMKSTPKILIGWQILVPDFGFGTVLSFSKEAGLRKKTVSFQVRFRTGATSETISLKLSLKNSDDGKFAYKKGVLKWLRWPFVLVSANGI
jgi:hypothetical protein